MMRLPVQNRTLALLTVIVSLLGLFVYVAVRSGPLAPVPVTVTTVETRPVTPALFGIGTVEARYTYKIGPTHAGRVNQLDVQVGDYVKPGQRLGEMDPVDLDERILAQEASVKRAAAALREAFARRDFARIQAARYERSFAARAISEEMVTTKRQELQIADAVLSAAREDLARVRADRDAMHALRSNLRLTAPVDGLVTAREAEPGTTVVAGQTVVEVIDHKSLWVNVRFDQTSATGLAPGLPAHIVLRSRSGQAFTGEVLRIEPLADAVTEETLAKILFDALPEPLPPVGELVEVTVALPELPAAPVVPNAALRKVDGKLGVWQILEGDLRFTPATLGAADLDGHVQVREGLKASDRVIVYSEKLLHARSRIAPVDRIPGAAR